MGGTPRAVQWPAFSSIRALTNGSCSTVSGTLVHPQNICPQSICEVIEGKKALKSLRGVSFFTAKATVGKISNVKGDIDAAIVRDSFMGTSVAFTSLTGECRAALDVAPYIRTVRPAFKRHAEIGEMMSLVW